MESKRTIWTNYSEIHDYPDLTKPVKTDVAIIGGGITGITTGLLLAKNGINATVFESHKIGDGATSHSTGNMYIPVDEILTALKSKYNIDVVKQVMDSRLHALEKVKALIRENGLDCDFREVPMYFYSNDKEGGDKLEEQYETGREADIPFLRANENEITYPHRKAIKLLRQVQVNPMRYVQGLARAAHENNCEIYEQTAVRSVERNGEKFELTTDHATIEAEYVVHATHSPKGVRFVQTLLGPYREYGIACRLGNQGAQEGIFWGYQSDGKKISTRSYSKNGNHFLIVVGEPHKTGQAKDNIQHMRNLERFARTNFDIQDIAYRWGGQHYRPADLLPYIGSESDGSKEMIATGFSTDGLVYGTLAGIILSDQIEGRINEFAELYNAGRHQPLKAATKFIKENVNVAGQLVQDYAGKYPKARDYTMPDLKAGDGIVIKSDQGKLAVYRRRDGGLDVVSAVCPHMMCIVHWNNAEESWDCPCHGSRFGTDGSVIEGPAYNPLQKLNLRSNAL